MGSYDISLRGHHLRILHGFLFRHRENSIRDIAVKDHSKRHADNVINVLQRIAGLRVKVKIIDTTDSICMSCDKKNTKACREFIPYDISAASDDRGTAHYYGLMVNRVYTAKHILQRLKEIGPME